MFQKMRSKCTITAPRNTYLLRYRIVTRNIIFNNGIYYMWLLLLLEHASDIMSELLNIRYFYECNVSWNCNENVNFNNEAC